MFDNKRIKSITRSNQEPIKHLSRMDRKKQTARKSTGGSYPDWRENRRLANLLRESIGERDQARHELVVARVRIRRLEERCRYLEAAEQARVLDQIPDVMPVEELPEESSSGDKAVVEGDQQPSTSTKDKTGASE